jgi:hypothetical protein
MSPKNRIRKDTSLTRNGLVSVGFFDSSTDNLHFATVPFSSITENDSKLLSQIDETHEFPCQGSEQRGKLFSHIIDQILTRSERKKKPLVLVSVRSRKLFARHRLEGLKIVRFGADTICNGIVVKNGLCPDIELPIGFPIPGRLLPFGFGTGEDANGIELRKLEIDRAMGDLRDRKTYYFLTPRVPECYCNETKGYANPLSVFIEDGWLTAPELTVFWWTGDDTVSHASVIVHPYDGRMLVLGAAKNSIASLIEFKPDVARALFDGIKTTATASKGVRS